MTIQLANPGVWAVIALFAILFWWAGYHQKAFERDEASSDFASCGAFVLAVLVGLISTVMTIVQSLTQSAP
jgi:cyanate permease